MAAYKPAPPIVGSFELNKEKVLRRIAFQDKIVSDYTWQSCMNCCNFEEKSENCLLFKGRPPAFIIVSGCKDHDFEIPF